MKLRKIQTWSRLGDYGYVEIDWRELFTTAVAASVKFTRVTGNATAAEAEAVVDAVAKYRAEANAFVVSNAVKIEGMAEMNAVGAVNAEAVKGFDVLSALLQELTEREQEVVMEMMK